MPDDPQVESLKLPPHSPEAEQSVLGGLLLDNEAVDKVGDLIVDADFYSDAHRLVYAHIVKLVADGKPADVVTVSESLASAQKLDYIGGLVYLGALVRQRADRSEHPPLCADRARPLDPAPARGDGRRYRRFGVQPARPQRQGNPGPGGSQGAAHRGAGRPRRAAVRGDRQAAGRGGRAHRNALQPRRPVRCHRRADGLSPISTG